MKRFLCVLVTITKFEVWAENEKHAKNIIEVSMMFNDFDDDAIESASDTHYHVTCFEQ